MPKCFQVHAEYDAASEIEQPIPMYDGMTLRELASLNEMEKVEVWLRNEEYIQYKRVQARVGEVEVTANFNGVRESLGLALSPCVRAAKENLA